MRSGSGSDGDAAFKRPSVSTFRSFGPLDPLRSSRAEFVSTRIERIVIVLSLSARRLSAMDENEHCYGCTRSDHFQAN